MTATNSVTSVECEVRVWYQDRNNAPLIADASFLLPLFSEQGTVVGKMFAMDPDEEQSLSFSITDIRQSQRLSRGMQQTNQIEGILQSSFTIDPLTGVIRLANTGLFDSNLTSVDVFVAVADNGIPSLNATSDPVSTFTPSATAHVRITEPQHIPDQLLTTNNVTIKENQPDACVPSAVQLEDSRIGPVTFVSGTCSSSLSLRQSSIPHSRQRHALRHRIARFRNPERLHALLLRDHFLGRRQLLSHHLHRGRRHILLFRFKGS